MRVEFNTFVDSSKYNELRKKASKIKKDEKNYKACVALVEDTQLMYFLTNNYPQVLQEFYEWQIEMKEKEEDNG